MQQHIRREAEQMKIGFVVRVRESFATDRAITSGDQNGEARERPQRPIS
jgi:hypothetical protein